MLTSYDNIFLTKLSITSGIPGGFGCSNPPPKFQRPSKIVPNSTRLWKLLKIAEFRMPTPQDVQKKGSKILKLPPVHNCFTLAVTNKLVVIINSLKVPKIKKILLYEMKFLALNYSCLQNPWLGGLLPQDPRSLCPLSSTEFVEPPKNKIPVYATECNILQKSYLLSSMLHTNKMQHSDLSSQHYKF